MRRVLVDLFFGLLFLVFVPHNSYAEMCGCMGKMGEGMHEEVMPMMGGMKHRGMGMMGAEHRMWGHLKGLGLDEKQKEAIKEIKSRVMKDTVRKRADIKVAGIELKDILDKDPVDMNAAEAKLKQIESLRTDMRLSRIKAIEEVKAKLTPDQRKKFKRSLERHRRWTQGGKGMTPPCEKKEGKQPPKEHMHH
jgi:Spy/CpxP family protein refolding chaperone